MGELLLALLLAALVLVLLSPLESLRWWSRSGYLEMAEFFDDETTGVPTDRTPAAGEGADRAEHSTSGPSVMLVYLSGIGLLDQDTISGRERDYVNGVVARIPGAVAVTDVYPYSVENRGLLARASRWLWSRLDNTRRSRPSALLPNLINLRNFLQLLVSADPRYGPTYSIGTAAQILEAVRRAGWREGVPVVIVGYSGGAQITVGSSWYLGQLGMRLAVVSIGGVYTNDPGLDHIEMLWHLYGSKDRTWRFANVLFPGRWPRAKVNAYGRAVEERRIEPVEIGPMTHSGREWYYSQSRSVPDGRSYLQVTQEATAERVVAWLGLGMGLG